MLAALLLAAAPTLFETTVRPFVSKSCVACHNGKMKAGGVNFDALQSTATLSEHRETWERVVLKIKTGEMPPKGIPRPKQADSDAVVRYLQREFEKADRLMKPDPGRVTARRLNRAEYDNTIRDLLGVDFRAAADFPADDSGYGFDNIGDVLSISPVLMEKYLAAAEKIASRAIGADPLPKAFLTQYKREKARRPAINEMEITHPAPYTADYEIRLQYGGNRGRDPRPPLVGALWVDGKVLERFEIDPRQDKKRTFEFRVTLAEGPHVLRIGFLHDPEPVPPGEAENRARNVIADNIEVRGPYAPAVPLDNPSRRAVLTCDPATGDACVTAILSRLARRAFRRPVAPEEIAGLAKFVAMAKADGQSAEQGIQLALSAMLVSPHFLFRIERDPAGAESAPVSDIELASRLSYFLWSSMPDEELLSLAERKRLRAPGFLEAQIARMLKDPKSRAIADNFAGQWLELRNLDIVKPDPQKFPEFDVELRKAMKTETQMFFDAMVKENRPLADFLDARFSYLNERLAKHYGIPGVEGPEFRRVTLATPQRGGILTHASVLTVSSYPTRTSPVIRGKYLLENVLGAPPPPPPPDVPTLDEEAVGNAGSLRQQLEKHRTNAVCASCHSRMDVLGFGLENYDAIGRWRTMDGKFPVDSSGTFPNGKSFVTPAQMKTVLRAETPEFARCVTEKMLTFALGRGLERYDKRTVEEVARKAAASDYRFARLIVEIARSLPFQARRGTNAVKEIAAK